MAVTVTVGNGYIYVDDGKNKITRFARDIAAVKQLSTTQVLVRCNYEPNTVTLDISTWTTYNGGAVPSMATLITDLKALTDTTATTLGTSDVQIGAVELKDGSTDNRAIINAANTVRAATDNVLLVQTIDASGNVGSSTSTTSGNVDHDAADSGNPVKIGGKASTELPAAVADGDRANASFTLKGEQRVMIPAHSYLPATHWSPNDGTFAYTSGSTITATGFPFTVDANCQIRSIGVTDNANNMKLYENGVDGYAMAAAANVVTIYRYGVAYTAFAATDVKYAVALNYQSKGYDGTTDSQKVTEVSPLNLQRDPATPLISAAQALTASSADLGPEIPCAGSNKVAIFITVDINSDANVRLKFLAKHTGAGSEEYPISSDKVKIFTDNTYVAAAASRYFELNDDADQVVMCIVDTDNIVDYLQVQVHSGSHTDGEIDAAYFTTAWN